jgi:hypothetical protein
MAQLQFPQDEYWKILESPETWMGGSFVPPQNARMKSVAATILKVGTHAGTEEFRLAIYHNDTLTALHAASDWISLADIEATVGPLTAQWRGVVPFEFATQPFIDAGQTYYLAVESQNYTRNALVFFVGWLLDWPFPENPSSSGTAQGMRMSFVVKKELGFA